MSLSLIMEYTLLLTALSLLAFAESERLGTYNVDDKKISVSGFSSGAFMTMQLHVIYSSHIMGAGMLAGGVYDGALSSFSAYIAGLRAESNDRKHLIDPLTNLRTDRVFIFNGIKDHIVKPVMEKAVYSFYHHYVTGGNIKTELSIPAEHGFPTENYGGPCGHLNAPDYINNCHYNGAYETLNQIYRGLKRPDANTRAVGVLKQYDATEFHHAKWGNHYSLDRFVFMYVPRGCQDKLTACRLHVALHGCMMSRHFINDHFVKHTGYNEVGELNNIIILYPQATVSLKNAQGCWDWQGYTGSLYGTNQGHQPMAIKSMIERVVGHW